MDNKQQMIGVSRGTIAVLILAGVSLCLPGCDKDTKRKAAAAPVENKMSAAQEAPMPPMPQLAAITVLFKLDTRLTRGLYMGDRWVSPATFTPATPQGKTCPVEAKAYGVDRSGRQGAISPKWKPQDPAMIKVEPDEGHQVTITVLTAGESRLIVALGDISKTIEVKAEPYHETLKVAIMQ